MWLCYQKLTSFTSLHSTEEMDDLEIEVNWGEGWAEAADGGAQRVAGECKIKLWIYTSNSKPPEDTSLYCCYHNHIQYKQSNI